ncbi:DUF485 domain-containing protein [Sporosarcina sp. Te-1]|uniref:DUF485 domain-containing protein n=1 Tax=Sporosarcina sp. Te-1 TaxID=2818390 RepID=UPI001A9E3AC4|nr:DUF485 domain-containing protein [Sporosarcina sp. Te-1]QTD41379.1 DUF485 domain-containing protein [Sporosarcina sp. Te-1]
MKVESAYKGKTEQEWGSVEPLSARQATDFERIVSSPQYKEMLRRKKRFIVPMTIFFLAFYFMLPIMTSYSTVLNTPVYGDITWAWVFATAQFIVTWVLCVMYVKKSNAFDKDADEVIKLIERDGGSA